MPLCECIPVYRLLDVLMLLCQRLNCYKISLECKDKVVPFYEQFGFSGKEQNYMVKRYDQ